ncbi:hypothetical protein [Runella slithyformis]|uniref:Uncharacterized protein n=1 Tax=Runella slithyformis (strain ATCC 29530 / DSM 19594 / LMG 11500 / NCIMB 11436 / LSU 4) TaxID=761193 RepID=A0A7U3ZPW9_RUNSL|nr:hypothetical protein [Runella slithyformis]AEI51143.1 hypothetical protein Runsl_4831 [Runella slithyformis DSM 19594]
MALLQNVTDVGLEKWLDALLALPNSFNFKCPAQMHQMMVDSFRARYPQNTYVLSNTFVGNVHFGNG